MLSLLDLSLLCLGLKTDSAGDQSDLLHRVGTLLFECCPQCQSGACMPEHMCKSDAEALVLLPFTADSVVCLFW